MESAAKLRKRVLWVLIGMGLFAAVLSLGAAWYTADWGRLVLNLGTKLAGAAVAYYLFERVIEHLEKLEAEREAKDKAALIPEKAGLIAELSSNVKVVAIAAAEKLARHGWLYDGSLEGADLSGANLQGAKLEEAKLQGAGLWNADLREARLNGADLRKAKLNGADLQGADLFRASLEGAGLFLANLQRAYLRKANLEGANLEGANLVGANLVGANLIEANLQRVVLYDATVSKDTILPDGTKWTRGTDMTRFTDPRHPDFRAYAGAYGDEEEK
jgi:hypothetical protein